MASNFGVSKDPQLWGLQGSPTLGYPTLRSKLDRKVCITKFGVPKLCYVQVRFVSPIWSLGCTGKSTPNLVKKMELDCIYCFPIDWEPNGISIRAKSIGFLIDFTRFRTDLYVWSAIAAEPLQAEESLMNLVNFLFV